MNLKKAKDFINSIKWKYARTYPQSPHEYSVLEWDKENKQNFIDFAKYIIKNGQDEYYYKKKFRVLIIDEYKYWTMDEDLEKTDLINRTYFDNNIINELKIFIKSEYFQYKKEMTLKEIKEQANEIYCKNR